MKIKLKPIKDIGYIPTSIPSAKVIIKGNLIDVDKIYDSPELDDNGEPTYLIPSKDMSNSVYHIPASFFRVVDTKKGAVATFKEWLGL